MRRGSSGSVRAMLGSERPTPGRKSRCTGVMAPRWTQSTARCTHAALRTLAGESNCDFLCVVRAVLVDVDFFKALARCFPSFTSATDASRGLGIFEFHRRAFVSGGFAQLDPRAHAKAVKVVRVLSDWLPAGALHEMVLPSAGVGCAESTTFVKFLEPLPAEQDRFRTVPDGGRVMRAMQRFAVGVQSPAVLCVERALGSLAAAASRGHHARFPVHYGALPTALASRGDHYVLLPEQRYLSVGEQLCAAGFPLTSHFARTLLRRSPAVLSPCQIGQFLGLAVHGGVFVALLEWADARGFLPSPGFRYRSAFPKFLLSLHPGRRQIATIRCTCQHANSPVRSPK
jgi:hypothetical protein